MNASDDTYIVEGAWGTVVETGITLSIVRWDSMLAFRADYRYRNELKDVKTGLRFLRAKWESLSKSLKLCSLPQMVNRLLI